MKKNPEDVQAWYLMGASLEHIGEYRRAADCYEAMLRVDQTNSLAWYHRGICLSGLGQYDEAYKCLGKVTDSGSDKAVSWISTEAELSLFSSDKRNKTARPMDIDVRRNALTALQADALVHLGREREALALYSHLIDADRGGDLNIWRRKGEALMQIGDYTRAIEVLSM